MFNLLKNKFTDEELAAAIKLIAAEVKKDLEKEYRDRIESLEKRCRELDDTVLDLNNANIELTLKDNIQICKDKRMEPKRHKNKNAALADEIFGKAKIDHSTGEVL